MNRFLLLIASLLALSGAAPAGAQGLILPGPIPRPLPAPAPRVLPLQLKSQHVQMQLQDGALRVEVEQTFYNPNGVPAEGTYLFPLPEGATVTNFRMTVDREPVEGKLLGVDEARRVYESYVRRNIDPAILEYVGRNAFQARIFPVPANGERHIQLVYSQAAEFNNGVYRVVYPLNSERLTGGSAGDVSIEATIHSTQPLKAIYSPSHQIQVKQEGDHNARISFEERQVRANRDFALYYTTSEKAFGLNALAHRRVGEDGYAMLMLAPKREVKASEIQPKDVVVVFDTSGSMQGAKIEQARKSLLTILDALNDSDRFNVIRFSSDVTSFRDSVVPVNAANRAEARRFVEGFKAVGGTAIDDALQTALASMPKAEERRGRAPFLIFMTDGLPTVGVTDIDRILVSAAKAAPADLRLFSFGVGSDVNTLLLDRLASEHHGAADYVAENEDLENKIGTFYAKISEPVLSNVHVDVAGARLTELYPSRIPDLFAGSQLLILGRYQGSGKATVTLTGELNGKPQRYTYDLTLPEREVGNDFIPKLWAGRRIGFLLEEIRLHGEKAELRDEVIRLSQEHGIVTPYTTYLVEEPGQQRPGTGPVAQQNLYFGAGSNLSQRGAAAQAPGGLGGGLGGGGFGGGYPGGGVSSGAAPGSDVRQYERGRLEVDPYNKTAKELAKKSLGDKKPALGRPGGAPAGGKDGEATGLSSGGQSAPAGVSGPAGPRGGLMEKEAQKLARTYDKRDYALQQKQDEAQVKARQQAAGFRNTTGWNAVEASRRVRELKDAVRAEDDLSIAGSRTVNGRAFRLENGAWKEAGVPAKAPVVQVKYGSDAYFQLISAKPEWAWLLSLGKSVLFKTGKTTCVSVGQTGKEKLTDAELKALEK